MDISYILGIAGSALILLAFLMSQMKKWKEDDIIYDITNFVGSFLLVIFAISGNLWPFIVLNTVWGLYSLHDIIVDIRNEKHKKYHILKSKRILKNYHE